MTIEEASAAIAVLRATVAAQAQTIADLTLLANVAVGTRLVASVSANHVLPE